ncbi:MAG: hypothetical protein NC914_03100 [Candidatus Omnitrophica bacterium]|nr:hypothetical protein [Candidatus Omnitrophota bacterium]
MEENPNPKTEKQIGRRLAKGCLIGCLAIIVLYVVAFIILVSLGIIVAKKITVHPAAKAIFTQFMDFIRELLGQIKDFFQGDSGGLKTL